MFFFKHISIFDTYLKSFTKSYHKFWIKYENSAISVFAASLKMRNGKQGLNRIWLAYFRQELLKAFLAMGDLDDLADH